MEIVIYQKLNVEEMYLERDFFKIMRNLRVK